MHVCFVCVGTAGYEFHGEDLHAKDAAHVFHYWHPQQAYHGGEENGSGGGAWAAGAHGEGSPVPRCPATPSPHGHGGVVTAAGLPPLPPILSSHAPAALERALRLDPVTAATNKTPCQVLQEFCQVR